MSNQSTERRSNDRFLAAICHLAGLVPLFGILVPAGVWLAMRAEKHWLARQAVRAMTAQALLVVLLLLLPGLGALLALVLLANRAESISLVVFFLSTATLQTMLVVSWLMFAHAAIRVFQDGDFRYPVLTRALEGPAPASS